MRTLKINGTDVSTLGATLLTVDYGYATVTTYKDWLKGSMNPIFYSQDVRYTTAEFKFLVEAEDRPALDLASSNLVALAQKGKYQVTDCQFYIDGNIASMEDTPISSKAKEVLITIEGIKSQDAGVTETIPIAETLTFVPLGNCEIPVKFDIIPNVSMPNSTLTVNGKDFTITDTAVSGGTGVYGIEIDGINGRVTVGGNNAIERYQAFEFPTLMGGKENKLEFTGGCSVRITYTARWM